MAGNQIDAKLKISVEGTDAAAAGLKGVQAGMTGVGAAADGAAAAATKAGAASAKAQDAAIRSAREQANQMRMLGPQITDIVTGLATGQSPLTVLLQQGGQLRDIFGGVGNALKAIGSLITVSSVAWGSLALTVGSVATAAYLGNQESKDLIRTLQTGGNIAGTSAGQFTAAAKAIAEQQRVSIGAARENLDAALQTGQYTGATLNIAAQAVTALRKVTGETADETIKGFGDMASGVAQWAAKHNQAYNFLTSTQYERIRALEAEGRSQEAMRVTMEALTATMESRHAPALGLLERAWSGVGKAFSSFWDGLKEFGRDETPEQRIDALRRKLDEAQKIKGAGFNRGLLGLQADPAALQQQLDDEQRLQAADQLRSTERAIALQEEQDRIRKASKSYQDALLNIELAGTAQRLAQTNAGLDAQQQAVNRANARGLTSARDQAVSLANIDRQRAQAQAASIEAQIGIEKRRVLEKPEDGLAQQARIKQLEAQLAGVQARIKTATSQAQGIIEADALSTARDRAQAWGAAWQLGADRVRELAQQNAAAAAALLTEPLKRAQAEADAAVAEIKRRNDDVRRELNKQIGVRGNSPEQDALLKAQLAQLEKEGAASAAQAERLAKLKSFKDQIAEANARLAQQEADIALLVESNDITTLQGEQRKFAARDKAIQQLRELTRLMGEQAATPAEKNDASAAAQQLKVLAQSKTDLEKSLASSAQNGFQSFFTDVATGAKSTGDALKDMVGGFAKTVLDLIAKNLGEQLVQSLFGKGGASGGTNWISTAASWIAGQFHSGGVVGASGGVSRSVSPGAWLGALRYHTGGIAGFAPNEVPAVLQRGEEVITATDPRHRNNGGMTSTIGGVTINTTINGANGNESDQQGAAASLHTAMSATINQWAVDQSRPGGILFKG